MKVLILWGQLKESYEGQHAPEALAVITEYANDENPDFLQDGMYRTLKVVECEVDDVKLQEVLEPKAVLIELKVNKEVVQEE